MSVKKKKEDAILNLVYSVESFDYVVPDEEPDFRLKHKFNESTFGVEVTEFYFSESRARIRNIPGYVSNIIGKGEYRHKDDKLFLEVKEFTLIPSDDKRDKQQIKGIFQEQPKIDQYISDVAKLINSKNKKFNKYKKGLSHVNLIVFDCEDRLVGSPLDKFHHFFFQPELERSLVSSDFREIFFVTKVGLSKTPRKVYIPLKMLFLLAEIYRFNFLIMNHYHEKVRNYSNDEEVDLLVRYLQWRETRGVGYKIQPDGYEVAYGNTSVVVSKDNKITVLDHGDYDFSEDFKHVRSSSKDNFFNDKFANLFEESRRTHLFVAAIGYDVKKISPNQ